MASLVKMSATVFLFKLLLGLVLLFVSIVRINAVSGVYLLCLLALPLIPSPTTVLHLQGSAGRYMKTVVILSALGCVTQILYQVVLAALDVYSETIESCNATDTIWRQLGYQRLDDLNGINIARLVVPDVILLVVSVMVFLSCKYILTPPQTTQSESSEHGESLSPVMERRPRRTSVVVEGLRSCNIMIFCALSGIILPSAISAVYFVSFLVVVTWWSFYQSWGRVFKSIELLWLIYSGAHVIILYIVQFQFFQELVPYDSDEGLNVPALVGLTPIIDSLRCDQGDDPREISIASTAGWTTLVNPWIVFLFYWFLGHEVQRWFAGPPFQSDWEQRILSGNSKRYGEYVEIVRRKSPKKRGKKSGKDEKQETDEHLVGEGAGTSYQTMDPTPQQTQEDATDGEVGTTGAESAPTSGDERGAHKMSAFTTLLGFLTKQSYIVGLILMMAWSIIYLSWITFVLLLWALLIWIVPISTTRNRCLYTSPLLVFYAEAIIIITFVYGLETNLPEKASGIDLKEVGLRHYKYPFIPLLVEMAFTLMFWLTLRQFLREQKLRRHNVDEGIVLQPFGVIFSGPEEEVMSTDVDGHHLHRGHSVTMTFLGQTLNALLAKYWILLCGLMFLIISLQGTVDIFKTIYMLLFLILLNIFMLSFTLFRFVLRVFGWIVVLYSMAVLCMIYTYQFTDLRNLWINNTFFTEEELAVLGLQKYDDLGMLITNLLIPTAFIILVMIQLHYFHNNFISISNIKSSGYRPGSLDEDGGSGKKADDEGSPAADAVIEVDETDKTSISSKKSSPTTRSTWKLKLAKAYHLFNTYLGPCQVFLWRLLEVHMMKLVFLTIILVVTKELTAVNGILLLIIFLPIAIPSLHRVCCMMSMLWVSVVLLGKMVFQLDYSNWFDVDLTTNCTENPDFPIQVDFLIPDWFGFKQVGYFYNYVEGYVAIIIMLIIYSIVMLHQQQYRNQRGLVKPDYSIVFNDITRECADKDGLPGCIKFLINYCFYKFGLEICFTTTAIVAAVRLDVFAFIFLLMMVPLLFIKRRKCAILWPLYMLVLIFLFPVAYALALGLPPVFCIDYPWTDVLPARLNTWLYLSNYLTPRDPNPSAIVADFFQLLFVCLQWQVFRVEKNHDIITGGGDNYELSVDVERIDLYPVPNFTFNRSYLDLIKSMVFGYAFYFTLAIVFLCATTRISILGLWYLVFAFYFLWYGPKFLTKPTDKVLKQWNFLVGYTLFVIFMKVGLQIMACAYGNDIDKNNLCWIMQLLGVICLQTDYTEEICGLPADQARLTWDVTCFLFVVFQRQIFTSNYFLYIVLDLTEEEKLASKGAELINEILAAKVRNKRLEEERILEGVKRKMKRIKEKQLKLTSKKNQTWQPKSHAEAIRGTGGYYMFEDVDDDDLSDLEAEGITSSGEPSSPKNPLQLAFHGIVEDPKKAIQIDKEHQAAISGAEEDPDDPDADAAVSGEGGDKDRFKDGKGRVDEAQDDDETATRGSYTDDIEMEQEEEPEGTVGKIKSALALTWLIFLRSVDTLIQFLDNISKEYRYVAKELKKLTTEGKRRRAMKKHKPAELQDMSGKESEKEELETKGTEEKQAKDGATGSPADENESPTRDIRVSINPEPTSEVIFQKFMESNGHDETCSTAETSSSDQFRRTMIRPVRLIYAALYAIIAQSQLVCYFIIILNQLLSASLLSLPLVLIVFLWAMLSVPRPTKTFWITVISYTEVIVILKYLFQFQFYPWNSDTSKDLHSTDPLWFPRILGIEQKPNYAVLDLCILLSVFFHRSVLIRHGLWQESRVVPDLDSQQTDDVPALTSTDMAVEDQNGDEMERAGKKDKKKKKKKRKEKEKKPAEEGGAKAEVLLSTDDEQQLEVQDAEHQGSSDLSELEDPPRRWYQPVINFYHNMIDPMYSAVTDVYVFIFGIQFICFLIIALFSSAFGEERATSDVAQLISSNTIPISFLLLLLIMFIIIVIDRAIYLCKNVKAKFIYLVVLVIAIHLWLFFILPSYNNKPFVDNNPAQVWYFFICIYFGLSAYQITSGYPTRILGNFLCKNYNLVSLVLFYGWRVIPFLTELRTLMDWIWTDTTLSLSHWLQVEDIYANVYPIKCFRNREVAYPVPRGTKTPWIIKYGVGGGMLIALIFVLWFPLILISLANTTSIMNPPTSMSVEIGFGGFEPIFKMNAQSEDLNPINTTQWNNLQAEFAQDLNARTFLDGYRQEDVVIATISGNSTGTWDISPPSRENLIKSLQTDVNLYIYFKYSFTRITNNAQVTPTIENNLDVILTKEYDEFRDNMTQQLEFTNVSSVMKNFIPSYIKVPALSSPEPVTILLEKGGYVNASLHLEVGGILDLVGTKEWWEVADSSSEESSTIQILTFNERVASELLAPLSSYGIIGLYVSLVLVIGRFLRMYFSGISYQIMFNELPNVDRILKLCLDIYLVRESDEMELEEDLTAKLIFLYRSPETLIKVTKWKTD
ncbi:piezo-type mechanosensitive ion channel component 1-like isoform X4 [Lytechinus variegatus]|uniref:piezo-type mechanosensitive ion channel component 1-like isoform X4 n=1 Tax=Lytechinus variegatus TaxID=7654 RepID=UPI001BB117C0|nr:piezo-type mechanosensitive ion channel component 1-like isoform X4 [Lytechinus variegatus]